jgi:hypothetical protein
MVDELRNNLPRWSFPIHDTNSSCHLNTLEPNCQERLVGDTTWLLWLDYVDQEPETTGPKKRPKGIPTGSVCNTSSFGIKDELDVKILYRRYM